jgi:hypothetical protein
VIAVKYTCFECGLHDATVRMIPRQPGEDVMAWLKKLSQALSDDHAQRSPKCEPAGFSNVQVPLHDGPVGTSLPS